MTKRYNPTSALYGKVSEATVIITDTKKYWVAIFYDYDEEEDSASVDAPLILAKGQYYLTDPMFQESRIKNIDKFDSPELANKLFYSSVIGQEIMENFYYSVAKILAFFINFKLAKTSEPIAKPDPDKYIDYFSSDSEFEKINVVVN